MAHELSQDQVKQVSDAVFAGRKIEAIKLYRKFTGVGLKDAKDFIEALAERLKAEHAGEFAAANQRTG